MLPSLTYLPRRLQGVLLSLGNGKSHLGVGFTLRCLQRLSVPHLATHRTVSRRSEPSSRTALMGGQPNPWNRIQLQDAMSRHRGAKPRRRCELLGEISLLSPG